ncbi:MAG: hypothetical protein GX132_02245 [Erysipelotrichia bacterium]|jgi:hypothetical protein|nr:hypothetical protein [Erysipelotrichia bacterium]
MKFVKYWLSLVIAALLVIAGGYLVYPKTPFITYDNQKFYGYPNDSVLVSKNGQKIEIIEDDDNNLIIQIEGDDVVIRLTFEDQNTLFISKNGVTFNGLIEFEEINIDSSLLKYAVLAKDWHMHSILMLEDYSIIFYVTSSIILLLSLFGLIRTIKNKLITKIVKIPLLVSLSVIITFTTIFNIILVATR